MADAAPSLADNLSALVAANDLVQQAVPLVRSLAPLGVIGPKLDTLVKAVSLEAGRIAQQLDALRAELTAKQTEHRRVLDQLAQGLADAQRAAATEHAGIAAELDSLRAAYHDEIERIRARHAELVASYEAETAAAHEQHSALVAQVRAATAARDSIVNELTQLKARFA